MRVILLKINVHYKLYLLQTWIPLWCTTTHRQWQKNARVAEIRSTYSTNVARTAHTYVSSWSQESQQSAAVRRVLQPSRWRHRVPWRPMPPVSRWHSSSLSDARWQHSCRPVHSRRLYHRRQAALHAERTLTESRQVRSALHGHSHTVESDVIFDVSISRGCRPAGGGHDACSGRHSQSLPDFRARAITCVWVPRVHLWTCVHAFDVTVE